jgi:putative membrane protein
MRGVASLAALLVLTVAGNADDGKPVLDREFVVKAAPCCHAIVQFAELAERQAQRPEVKAYAKKLIKDHKEMQEQLAKSSVDQKTAVASGTEKSTRDELERLGKLQAGAFDQAFLDRMVQDHEKAVRMCKNQNEKGTDAKIRQFASTCQTKLEDHLKEAKALGGKSKPDNNDNGDR